jgi:Ca2+-binding RTX toxin-like protein
LSLWEVFAGQGADAINVLSVGAGVSTVVAAVSASTVTVGTPTVGGHHTLQNILCSLLVASNSTQEPTVLIDDSGNPSTAARTVTFNNDPYGYRIHNLAPGDLYLRSGTGSPILVKGDSGNETFSVQDLPANIPIALDGGGGTNTLVGPNTTNTWEITGTDAGTLDGTVAFSSVQNLTGGTGLDAFVFSAGQKVTGTINGGGGGDWLDYAAYTTPVTVNLAAGTATGVGGGIANIQNVRGSQGGNTLTGDAQGNILIGGAGADTIVGGSGRSILIGDKGPDTITAGSGDTILIGGFTDFDSSSVAHDLALESILAEWQSSNSYATRISHIKNGGGLNGSNTLVFGVTVHDDGSANTLIGGSGNDWFFKGIHDTIKNFRKGEQVN